MADFNHKDERILKLYNRGLSLEVIARKIGMPGNLKRIQEGLERKGVTFHKE